MSDRKNTVAIIAPFPPPTGGMALQAEKLYKKMSLSGIKTLRIPSNTSFPALLSWIENLKGVRAVMRLFLFTKSLLKIRDVSVVQIFGASHVYFFLVVLPSIVVSRMVKKKIILHYHGGEAEAFLKKWGSLAEPVIRRADVLAVPSPFLKDVFMKVTGREAVIVPNIIDIDVFAFRERSSLKPNIIVSRQLEARYNVACALKAFGIIKKRYPEARLYIAGSGPEEDNLKNMQREMQLQDVHFLGLLSHEELSHAYNDCDIMINASRSDNFPGSILEAYACGIPVVSTEVGGISHMMEDRVTGLLVEPDDHEGIAEAVSTLISDSSLANNISVNGRAMAEDHCWEKVRKVLFALYELENEIQP